MTVERVDVYFDFTCGFANRLHLWFDGLDVDADWRPFSLLEANRGDDCPPVWERDDHVDDISLLMLAGHELVRDHEGDTARYRSQMFAAWHGSDQRLDATDVLEAARRAGRDADHDQLRAAVTTVGARHRDAVAAGVFGSSTIVFHPSGRGGFVRFTDVPSVADGPDILAALRTLARQAPELDHLEPLRA